MTLQASLYSSYRADSAVGTPSSFSKRRFDMAGGVWRELPRKRGRIRRFAMYLAATTAMVWAFSDHTINYIPVSVAPVEARDIPVYLDTNAMVQAGQTVNVHVQMDGQLSEILFREGQDVKAGDVLARLDPRNYQMQYDEAVVNLNQDQAMLAKIKATLIKLASAKGKRDQRAIDETRSQLHQFETTIKADDVTIETFKTQLSRTTLTSPIDGRTGIRQVDAGNMVHAADANGIVVVTQMEPVSAVFSLPEKSLRPFANRLAKKEPIPVLAVDTDNQAVLDEGTLATVDSQVDAMTGQVHLKASFPNHKRVLWPGASMRIRLLASSLKSATVVPATSVHYPDAKSEDESLKPWVYVYKPDTKKVEKRFVTVTMTQDGDAVIGEGVHSGEQVVTASAMTLSGGSHVTTAKTDAAK